MCAFLLILSFLINSFCRSIFMILMLVFSNNLIPTTPLCVAVNTSECGYSFRFSIYSYFKATPIIHFSLVQSDIFSSNQDNTEFQQVHVKFTFTSCLFLDQDSSGYLRKTGSFYHLWIFFLFITSRPIDLSSPRLPLVSKCNWIVFQLSQISCTLFPTSILNLSLSLLM